MLTRSKSNKTIEGSSNQINWEKSDNTKKTKYNTKKLNKQKQKIDQILANYYYNTKNPGSYSGLHSFINGLKISNIKIPKETIKNWLISQKVYTRHFPLIKKFKRNVNIYPGINDTWQIDLCDMRAFNTENQGYNYILTVIDGFSKFGWAFKLKKRTALEVLNTIRNLVEKYTPKKIHSDEGNEFFNNNFKTFLKSRGIKLYLTNSELKATIVERFNRTIKEKMWRLFSHNGNHCWVNHLDDIILSYNNTKHRSIKFSPIKVNKKTSKQVFLNLYGYDKSTRDSSYIYKQKFKVGDSVRLSKYKTIFEKGYTPNYTNEIFIITKVLFKSVPTYVLEDLNGEEILGKFYQNEILKVNINSS